MQHLWRQWAGRSSRTEQQETSPCRHLFLLQQQDCDLWPAEAVVWSRLRLVPPGGLRWDCTACCGAPAAASPRCGSAPGCCGSWWPVPGWDAPVGRPEPPPPGAAGGPPGWRPSGVKKGHRVKIMLVVMMIMIMMILWWFVFKYCWKRL